MASSIKKTFVFALIGISGIAASAVHTSISRVIDIHQVEHLENHRIRITFTAEERDSMQRFPITTIDRDMVKVDFTNTSSAPAVAENLQLHGASGNDLKRAMYLGFSLHRKLNGRGIEELRSQVGLLIKELPSEYMTVSAISQDSARILADVNPDKGDNINRILQQIQSLEPEGEGPALADTMCVAAERFHAWDLSAFKKSDQKILIIMSNPGDSPSTERFRGQNCWRSLMDQGVRVYHIAFGQDIGKSTFNLSNVAMESGGYVHRVSGPVEMNAATKNVMALLKNEYVVDVDAPDIALEDQPIELKIRISYHDEVFESPIYNVGFVIPDLSQVFMRHKGVITDLNPHRDPDGKESGLPSTDGNHSSLIVVVILAVLLFIGLIVLVLWLKSRAHTVGCNTCGMRVLNDHSNCRFRSTDCRARLVVIGGRYAGRTIPVLKGETTVARIARNNRTVKIRGSQIRWFNHGTIQLDGHKALYTPRHFGRDRINGWIVHEPRLLGQGHVLTIGDQRLRFEIKP